MQGLNAPDDAVPLSVGPLSVGLVGGSLRHPPCWFFLLSLTWLALLAAFHGFPRIDLQVSNAFFRETACDHWLPTEQICGYFPYSRHDVFVSIRKVLFYTPAIAALGLLILLLNNLQHHGATYCRRTTRDISIALTSFVLGPIIVVNMIIKEISSRPRPHQTDFFGGLKDFTAAGDFNGACDRNCSFISGEAAGAGWLACLVLLIPPPLRNVLGPPLITVSLVSPALRLAFGGHYLSDVVLGWLSSLVVYAAVTTCFEMSQQKIKRA